MTNSAASKDDDPLRALPRRRQSREGDTAASAIPDQPSLAYLLQEGHRYQARERRVNAISALARSSRLAALLDLRDMGPAQDPFSDADLISTTSSSPRMSRSYSPTARRSDLIAHSLRAARRVLDSTTFELDDIEPVVISDELDTETAPGATGDATTRDTETSS